MAGLPPGGVLIPHEPHILLVKGEPVYVQAVVDEYLYGDSCVLIETGDRQKTSRFWVPTRNIHRCVANAVPVPALPEVPAYEVNPNAPVWDWRSLVTKP